MGAGETTSKQLTQNRASPTPDIRGRMAGDIGHGAADNRVLLDLTTSMQCSSIRRRLSFDSNG
jgi:hypothetical protein